MRYAIHKTFLNRSKEMGLYLLFAGLSGPLFLSSSISAQPLPSNWPDAYPSWWYHADPAQSLIDVSLLDGANNSPENHHVLNQGQLWHMADRGIAELDQTLALIGGAGFTLNDFKEPGAEPNYRAPAKIGQLKFVSSAFYERFANLGIAPISPDPDAIGSFMPIPLIAPRAGSSDLLTAVYPWSDNVTSGNDAVALLGQAKHVFSWDIAAWAEADNDGDSLENLWELVYGFDFEGADDGASDPDGDGFSNASEFAGGTDPNRFDSQTSGQLSLARWSAIAGSDVIDLLSDSKYLDEPDSFTALNLLQFPTDAGDNYGQETKGFLQPDQTGLYRFYISGNSSAEFRLSSSNVVHAVEAVCSVPAETPVEDWDVYPEQESANIYLEAGQSYYFEILHKEDTNADNCAVAWARPDAVFEIIPLSVVSGVSPNDWDIDSLPDNVERQFAASNVNDAFETIWDIHPSTDLDGDGIGDIIEASSGYDTSLRQYSEGPFGDFDSDRLANWTEEVIGTSTASPDADSDLLGSQTLPGSELAITLIGRGQFRVSESETGSTLD